MSNENNKDNYQYTLFENVENDPAESVEEAYKSDEESQEDFIGDRALNEATEESNHEDKNVLEDTEKSEKRFNVRAALEAILFAMGDSVELEKLAQAIGISPSFTKRVLDEMRIEFDREDRGIRLLELNGSYQFCTKKEYFDCLITLAKQPKKPSLTDVVLETLAIIAYRQPITKAEIEAIRGVKSDHAVNKLIEYDLVQELGRLDAPGRPILLGTTEVFLRHFGLDSMEELPELNPVQLEDFKAEAEAEIPI